MKHLLPELPYPKDALQPHISSETLDYHHGKHHRTYVDNLNTLIKNTPFESQTLEQIIKEAKGPIFNDAAQAWNHAFFWKCLTPDPRKISTRLLTFLDRDFGSLGQFQMDFVRKGSEVFGSGWLWLIEEGGKLRLKTTHDADNPLRQDLHPLLTCDLWEHAYYIDYRNERADFLKSFVEIINWDFVEGNLRAAMATAA